MTNSVEVKCYNGSLWRSTIDHDVFCEHRLAGHAILHVMSGVLVIEGPNEHIEAHAGEYVFLKRDCTSSIKKCSEGDVPFTSIALGLPRDFLKQYFAKNLSSGHLPKNVHPLAGAATSLPVTLELAGLFASLKVCTDMDQEYGAEAFRLKLAEAVMCLLAIDERFFPTLFDFHETWKIDLMDFLEHHFTEDLSLEEFAHYTGRSLATFKRDFAKVSPMSPQKWILEQRLVMARRLIIDEGLRTTEVIVRTGFRNRSHFSSAFKLRFGVSPSEVRRTQNTMCI